METRKVWVSKYALSAGIEEVPVAIHSDGMVEDKRDGRYCHYFRRDEWHETREAAVADAERRRVAKIASLRKQIAKLEKLKFGE